ncbi:MAG: site-specific integrase [Chitinophagaceae bacterium]
MMELLDVRFNYLCRTTFKNVEGLHPIVLRIIYRSQRRDLFTGLYCTKNQWDPKTLRLFANDKKTLEGNKNLDLVLRKANNVFDELRYSGEPFSIDELVDKIKGKESKPTLLIDFIQESNLKMHKRVGIEITKPTYYKYRKCLEYVQEFLLKQYKSKNFLLIRINVGFLDNFFRFLRFDKEISHNTSLKYLSFLKVVLGPAIRSGVIKDDPFRELKIKAKPVYREFLTQDEIDKVEGLILENEDLNRKKDIFLFACFTGLAYIDLRQLNRKHIIQESDGSFYILKPRQKTGQECIIPLLPPAERILKKYSPTESILDFHWYISTNQKMNLGLKYIGQKSGITKTLHMHL